jgi:hypothetical protein
MPLDLYDLEACANIITQIYDINTVQKLPNWYFHNKFALYDLY